MNSAVVARVRQTTRRLLVVAVATQLGAVVPNAGAESPDLARVVTITGSLVLSAPGRFTLEPDGCSTSGDAGAGPCTATTAGTYSGTPCDVKSVVGTIVVKALDATTTMDVAVTAPTPEGIVTGTFGDGAGIVTGTLTTRDSGWAPCATERAAELVLTLTSGGTGGGVRYVPTSAEDVAALATASDPVLIAEKRADAALIAPHVTELLVRYAAADTAPAGSSECRPDLGIGPPPSCPPGRHDASISGAQAQEKPDWCVPAAAAIMLGSQRPLAPSQAQLAGEMGTQNGTPPYRAVPVLNRHRNPAPPHKAWTMDIAESPRELLDMVVTETWTYRQTAMVGVAMGSVGYYRRVRKPTAHALVAYGYDTAGGGSIHVFDPLDGNKFGYDESHYGPHYVGAAALLAAMPGGLLIW